MLDIWGVSEPLDDIAPALFGANRRPRPFVGGLVSADGLAFPNKMKTFGVIKVFEYLFYQQMRCRKKMQIYA